MDFPQVLAIAVIHQKLRINGIKTDRKSLGYS